MMDELRKTMDEFVAYQEEYDLAANEWALSWWLYQRATLLHQIRFFYAYRDYHRKLRRAQELGAQCWQRKLEVMKEQKP